MHLVTLTIARHCNAPNASQLTAMRQRAQMCIHLGLPQGLPQDLPLPLAAFGMHQPRDRGSCRWCTNRHDLIEERNDDAIVWRWRRRCVGLTCQMCSAVVCGAIGSASQAVLLPIPIYEEVSCGMGRFSWRSAM